MREYCYIEEPILFRSALVSNDAVMRCHAIQVQEHTLEKARETPTRSHAFWEQRKPKRGITREERKLGGPET